MSPRASSDHPSVRGSRSSTRLGALGISLVLVAAFLLLTVQGALAAVGDTTRASVDSAGAEAEGPYSYYPSVTPDGRYVVFTSAAANLVPGDTNGETDVFVHDFQTGATERVSVNSAGEEANGGSSLRRGAAISADGRYVVFQSTATNLVPGGTSGRSQVFVHDRVTGETELVSVRNENGAIEGNGDSGDASISPNGRYVVFDSSSSNLSTGFEKDENEKVDAFIRNVAGGHTYLVSHDGEGHSANGTSSEPSVADNGSVVFTSTASNLTRNGVKAGLQVFIDQFEAGYIELISGFEARVPWEGSSNEPTVSANGCIVAYVSEASNIVPGDTNGAPDVFVKDCEKSSTERISVDEGKAQGNGPSLEPSISSDGRYVAFDSYASNLVPMDTDGEADVFVHDRLAGSTKRVSVDSQGDQEAGSSYPFSYEPAIGGDGDFVAFTSRASNLVPGDENEAPDIFLHDVGAGPVQGPNTYIKNPSTAIFEEEPTVSTKDSTPRFELLAAPASKTFLCRLDSAGFEPCSGPGAHEAIASPLADGPHVLEVSAVDAEGHRDLTPAVLRFTVDTVAPDTSITSGPPSLTDDATPTVVLSSDDPSVTTFECVLDSVSSPCGREVTFGPLADGTHVLKVRAIDAAGNRDQTPASLKFTLDTVPPETSIVSGPSGPTKDSTPTFKFASTEPGSTYLCRYMGESFSPCSGPGARETFSEPLPDGSYILEVRAVDRAGNVDPGEAYSAFTVDTVAPETTIVSGPGATSGPNVTFEVSTSEGTLECRLDEAAFAPCESPVRYEGLAVGPHVFRVRGKDAAGNVGTPVVAKFKVK